MRTTFTAITFAVLLGASVLAGCSSDSTPSTCQALQDFSASLQTLVSPDTLTGGKSAVKSAFDDAESSFNDVKKSASDQFGSDVDSLDKAVSDLGDAISNAGQGGSVGDSVSAVTDAINQVVSAYDTLQKDASSELSDCNLSPASTAAS